MDSTRAVAFLFDADAEGVPDWYGGLFDSEFLSAISRADPSGSLKSAVLRGDLLLGTLAEKTISVSRAPNGSGEVRSHDYELLRTVIWDLADAVAEQWNSLDSPRLLWRLGNTNIHCVVVPTMDEAMAVVVDVGLRPMLGYLGALQVDLGNPIQRQLLVDWLIKDAAIFGGQVVLERSFEGHVDTVFAGADTFHPNGPRIVEPGALRSFQPRTPIPSELSARGRVSAERFAGKRKFSLQERVLSALSWSELRERGKQEYAFDAGTQGSGPVEASLTESKFTKYLLNLEHPKGKSKAKFFREVLGIDLENWRFLAAQLHDGLKTAQIEQTWVKEWQDGMGITFNAVMWVRGLNGRSALVESNWIMEPGHVPRFSTAYPCEGRIAEEKSVDPAIVPANLSGAARFESLFRIALGRATAAALAVVPTPMFIVGYGAEKEGACGFAWVRVRDARRGFARWLISNGHASRHFGPGAQHSSPLGSQSYDRNLAYANEFAVVLAQNGIECKVEWRLD